MRFGWLAATAAMVCASQAGAETITQGFVANFLPVGSIGPVQVGKLALGDNQVIRSATIFYDATTILNAGFATIPGSSDTGAITYSGTVGFAVASLPVALSASNAFSGSQACTPGLCSLQFDLAGSLLVPTADLAVFAGATSLFIAPTGSVDYSITYNNRPAVLGQQSRVTAVQGRIVYDVTAVPELASWAMMLLGIGAVGAVMRRRSMTFAVAS